MTMPVTGVIFDCDGTLLDSAQAWLHTQNELTRRARVELTPEEVDTICALTIPETGIFFHDRFGLGSSAEEVVDVINDSMRVFYATEVQARKDALIWVKSLTERGIPCSVASSTPQSLLQVGLQKTGFTPYLHAIVSVDDAGASKREPAVYDFARELMGTPKETTWVFEDSAYALHTLQKAGYPSVGIYDSDLAGTLEELALANIVIKEFSDLEITSFLGL